MVASPMFQYKICRFGGNSLFLECFQNENNIFWFIGKFYKKDMPDTVHPFPVSGNACFGIPHHIIYDTTQSCFCQLQASYFLSFFLEGGQKRFLKINPCERNYYSSRKGSTSDNFGGGEESRTPVRKQIHMTFSGCRFCSDSLRQGTEPKRLPEVVSLKFMDGRRNTAASRSPLKMTPSKQLW